MKSIINYIAGILKALWSLVNGMKVTGYYFIHPGQIVTQKYPENRKKLKMKERFKGELIMPHNEKNEHKCTACGICQINCPNGSIEVIPDFITSGDGKKKRFLKHHIYHLEMCTFCGLCIKACPSGALAFSQEFEHAVFNKKKLIKTLNKEGSQLMKGVE